ncbi:Phd-YefM [Pseudomonas sp. 31-12]|uniref:type II toxin-antitoxin system Phd/YefM family antitoxin n=1 Tax=Pseudomonas sp. 31-12 TaxID=2201356 RepID=UPI000D6CD145|nr:type II toxin-antitoxin system Phd/YefM family antitoxin [Pseudomonas sp. 31-12]AWM90618.1 Phd-YefM [Pseudomonas sp. 31-12]
MTASSVRGVQAVSTTAMVRGFSTRLKGISGHAIECMVIVKNNQPVAVIINVDAYQEMLDEIKDLRVEAAAAERLTGFDQANAICHDDMRTRYARKD